MKNKIIILILLQLSVIAVSAQLLPGGKKDKFEQNKKLQNSDAIYFTGIGLSGMNALDDWGVEFNVHFGRLITSNFTIGINYHSLISKNLYIIEDTRSILRMQGFALQPEYLFWLDGYFLITAYGNIGAAFVSRSNTANLDVYDDPNGDWVLTTEQGVSFNYRMLQELWFSIEAGYRSSFGVNYESFENADISGMIFGVTFKIFVF